MKFVKISSPVPVVNYLAEKINGKLAAGQKVFWLVPGGSAMKIAAAVAKEIKNPHSGLAVSLTDERYGPLGHADSNWYQLAKNNFKLPAATKLPVLTGLPLDKTAAVYQDTLLHEAKEADYSIALAGMGPDGHILGIKPGSPAVDSADFVSGYKWDDYVRLTATGKFLELLDGVVIYAVGAEKWPQFDRLAQDISPNIQPAQLLKRLKSVIIFNDYKEGTI